MQPAPEENLPDPNGPPVARSDPPGDMWRMAGSLGIKLGVGTIATLVVLTATASTTSGALRSHRVQWEQRQKEIAAAQQSSDSAPDEADTPSSSPPPLSGNAAPANSGNREVAVHVDDTP
jgi:hypothetical protein